MQYKYLKDPLFLFCLLVYSVNRWLVKPFLPNPFSQNYLNDLICIPFWVPIMLWMMRKSGIRNDDAPPRSYEVLIPLIVWSAIFEMFLPRLALFRSLAFSDHMDILFYTLGALLASAFWRFYYEISRKTASANSVLEKSPQPHQQET